KRCADRKNASIINALHNIHTLIRSLVAPWYQAPNMVSVVLGAIDYAIKKWCFGASSYQSMPDARSFPLDSSGRFAGDVIDYAVNALDLVDNAVRHTGKETVVKMIIVRCHSIHGRHRT